MSNDLMFLNTYTEVMHDNLVSIIKQNFVFQTQLKIAENKSAQLDDANRRADELLIQNRELQSRVTELSNITSSYKTVADDKGRLQVSLNETSQVKNQLQAELNASHQELTRLRNQVEELETLRKENAAYKKKLGVKEEKLTKEKPVESKSDLKALSGTF
jgi:chromosome segregation ATPase